VDLVRHPEVEGATVSNYRSAFIRHILPLIGDVPIPELAAGPALLRTFVRDVASGRTLCTKKPRRASAQVVRNVAYGLTKFFDDALGEEWINLPANPMRHPAVRGEIPSPQSVAQRDGLLRRGEAVHLTLAQASKLVTCEEVPEFRRVLYIVGMLSGLRAGELYGLRWGQVLFDDAVPHVRVRRAFKLRGKKAGGKLGTTLGDTKTDDSDRDVPLHPIALRALRAWHAEGWSRHAGRTPTTNDPVFASPLAEFWRPRDAQHIQEDLTAAKVPTKYRDVIAFDFKYATRTSFATWLGNARVEEALIDRLMGHSRKSTARRHYIDDDLAPLLAAVKTIKLDLSVGKIVALALALVVGGSAEGDGETDARTAVLTADCGKAAASERPNVASCNVIDGDPASVYVRPVDARGVHGDAVAGALGQDDQTSACGTRTWAFQSTPAAVLGVGLLVDADAFASGAPVCGAAVDQPRAVAALLASRIGTRSGGRRAATRRAPEEGRSGEHGGDPKPAAERPRHLGRRRWLLSHDAIVARPRPKRGPARR
jgi:integrase